MSRVEIRPMLEGRDLDVFVKAEYCDPGEVVPLLICAFGETEAEAQQMMHDSLHTPLCDAYAKLLGESIDSRALGAVIERRARSPGATVTEMEVMSALDPIVTAARTFRQKLHRHEEMRGASILDVVYPMGRVADVSTFRRMLDELCEVRDKLGAAGWQEKTTRGPIPRGGQDEWMVFCFIHAWERCIGLKVSTSETSRFMRAACELLPLSGVTLGAGARDRIARIIKRGARSRVAPLPRVR